MPADPLQRRQYLGGDAAPLLQRSPHRLLAIIERLETCLRLRDPLFDGDHTRRGLDELLIEFAPVVADRLDLALEPCLGLERPTLLGADSFQLLIACFESIRARGNGWSFLARGLRQCGGEAEQAISQ
jgi:hypothetical protein